MDWFINDLSLSGQYATADDFRAALESLIRLRQQRAELQARLYCSQLLHSRLVTPSATLRDAIFSLKDQVFKRLALAWFANSGPFWEADRTPEAEDCFYFEGEDITETGLGESARRQRAGSNAGTFSFLNPPENRFRVSALEVLHGLPDIPLGTEHIANVWEAERLLLGEKRPLSWLNMVEMARDRFPLLMLSTEISGQLNPHPYSPGRAERILELLRVLQDLAAETTEGESRNAAGSAIYKNYFTGSRPWFTDEGEDNKRDFRHYMTFADPEAQATRIFCPWHGKAKVGDQFRVHFEWPRPRGQRVIKVMYIGPKLTKR